MARRSALLSRAAGLSFCARTRRAAESLAAAWFLRARAAQEGSRCEQAVTVASDHRAAAERCALRLRLRLFRVQELVLAQRALAALHLATRESSDRAEHQGALQALRGQVAAERDRMLVPLGWRRRRLEGAQACWRVWQGWWRLRLDSRLRAAEETLRSRLRLREVQLGRARSLAVASSARTGVILRACFTLWSCVLAARQAEELDRLRAAQGGLIERVKRGRAFLSGQLALVQTAAVAYRGWVTWSRSSARRHQEKAMLNELESVQQLLAQVML